MVKDHKVDLDHAKIVDPLKKTIDSLREQIRTLKKDVEELKKTGTGKVT
jgi:hypothetical protein